MNLTEHMTNKYPLPEENRAGYTIGAVLLGAVVLPLAWLLRHTIRRSSK